MSSPPAAPHLWPVRFVGSGSEYFRIWIVNLLLTLVTLGLYYPWAKLRRLRYFYGSTEVAGRALAFHGDARRMLRGYLLVGLLFIAYSVAWQVSPAAGLVALLALAALWPALWRAGLRFRLGQTSWSGLRAGFSGSAGGAYRALLPLAPALVTMAMLARIDQGTQEPGLGQSLLALSLLLLTLALLPLLLWSMRRYQHAHLLLGSERSAVDAGRWPVYRALLAAALIGLAGLLLALALSFLIAGLPGGPDGPDGTRRSTLAPALAGVFTVLLAQATVAPYVTARLQNLFWNHTRSRHLRVHSTLRARALVMLSLKNWALIIVTLGLYLPFASIAKARLRLQAVTVQSELDADALLAGAPSGSESAAGDAAGDLFGVDLGL
ncbi:YjgN family protein [Pseudorhodoferax sp.]|uniref:YjgN family protein n=1 Tax=Pseudorhodoferax sp. TaxID=1993553 RepID=UPI002DD63C0E|nr:YjgN family protein [Pseudorhodoferax sp.]